MAWFFKPKYKLKVVDKRTKDKKEGLWTRCVSCKEIIYNREWEENLRVCHHCNHHYRLSAMERIKIICDDYTFIEQDAELESEDPLSFKHNGKDYRSELEVTNLKTELKDSIVSGAGEIHGHKAHLCVMDFKYFGGSLGTVAGEKIVRAVDDCIKHKLPLIIFSCSGGARMQEGMFSLMQMSKTCTALSKLALHKLLYISVLTDPTMGGVSASYAFIGDIILAEPNALIGFAGPRVIEQTIKQTLPEGFQRSEFLLEHGFLDLIVPRVKMKDYLYNLLKFFSK